MKRTEDSFRDIWDNIKCTNIQIIGVPEEEKKKKVNKKIFEEIIVENLPNMEKEIVNQIQEARRVPSRRNPRRNTPRHILIKLTKTKHKERILKAAREKQQVTYKGNPIGLTVDLSGEILQARREWQDISKVLKGENMQPRLLYPERFSFKIDGEIKSFSDKQKLKRIQDHQTSFTTNVKWTYTVKKYNRRKKIYKINPKQENDNRNIYINNYFKCKFTKCANQKTQTG